MSGRRDAKINALEKRIGYRFADLGLLEAALTHPSAIAGKGARGKVSYQRLEFLGDRVLGLVVADMLFTAFAEADEGELARRLTALVRNESCADVARSLELGEVIRLGEGEEQSGGRNKAAILGDVCEAVIGAIHMDGGLEPARTFVERFWKPRMLDNTAPLRDAKTTLQEWSQGQGRETPSYAIVGRSGPDHAPRFDVEVAVEEMSPALGTGRTKREAEQRAATAFLVREGVWKADRSDD